MVNLLGQVRYQDYMWDMVTPRIEVHREIMSEDELEEWRRAAGFAQGSVGRRHVDNFLDNFLENVRSRARGQEGEST